MPDPTQPSCLREHHGFVRVAAVSPELKLGDVAANVAIIRSEMQRLAGEGCRLIVFPELCLTGYSCADLFYQRSLQQQALNGVKQLAEANAELGCCIVVGLPLAIQGRLYNVAAIIGDGEILGYVPKTFLPNSGEFYERRWFSPAQTLTDTHTDGDGTPVGTDLLFEATDLPGFVLGIEICEDLWTVIPPSSHAALAGATLLANPSASNEVLGKFNYRRQLITQQSARCLASYIYASAGAGESSTDTVYSGHSLIAENGVLMGETERFSFETRAVIADVDLQRLEHERMRSTVFRDAAATQSYSRITFNLGEQETVANKALQRTVSPLPFVPPAGADRQAVCEEIFAIQATALARRLRQTHSKTAVLGLSGGLDSTLALLVMIEALKRAGMPRDAALTITMPGFGTTSRTKGNAEKLAEALHIPLRTIPIGAAVEQHFKDISHPPGLHDVTYENSQARERTQVLMDVANQTNGIVVGTGDLSESALGWCTFNGDHMSMYHVNAGVPKTLVKYLIEWCATELYAEEAGAILHDIIDTPISPELLPLAADGSMEQKTEDTVGPYELHDFFLFHFVRHGCGKDKILFLAEQALGEKYGREVIEKWLTVFLRRFVQSQFKRSSMPDGPKVGSVALSPRGDWRMPSDYSGSAF
ncbi:NAD+ synthase (glutamine-hydrolysing) [Prosthecobacter fusiformis]|uniref:Glutamine-dependent NAD(+) synthetase n=1 Tax=Prosthecobacter fusiformis TaxID=48464 RepID=A0A4R7RNF5_9BACT|nr:NAD(+) synthase [Prosthecobacter fusiformis]TDU66549.1 NAD+ synthase (glutamine-hydrolysing) [Prosthecobacter fusiformis]